MNDMNDIVNYLSNGILKVAKLFGRVIINEPSLISLLTHLYTYNADL